jgi:hypothetical protein
MKRTWVVLTLLLLTSPLWAEDHGQQWTRQLSPRMQKAFRPMLADDWSPKRLAELTPQERDSLRKAAPHLQELAQQMARSLSPKAPPKN